MVGGLGIACMTGDVFDVVVDSRPIYDEFGAQFCTGGSLV